MARTAVVTGGTGTLGAAIAVALGERGHHVVLLGRRPERAAEVEAAVRAAGGEASFVRADLRDPTWTAVLPDRVDVLVHDAAAYAPFARVEAALDEDWREVFAVGPDAAMRAARRLLPGMRARGFGRIVLVGSVAASTGGHGQAAYAAAKSALVGLARTLALEGGPDGVTCNVVEVGLLRHPRNAALSQEVLAGLTRRAAVPRLGEPAEVAAVVAFLASDEAGWISGAVLPVSGGLGLRLT